MGDSDMDEDAKEELLDDFIYDMGQAERKERVNRVINGTVWQCGWACSLCVCVACFLRAGWVLGWFCASACIRLARCIRCVPINVRVRLTLLFARILVMQTISSLPMCVLYDTSLQAEPAGGV